MIEKAPEQSVYDSLPVWIIQSLAIEKFKWKPHLTHPYQRSRKLENPNHQNIPLHCQKTRSRFPSQHLKEFYHNKVPESQSSGQSEYHRSPHVRLPGQTTSQNQVQIQRHPAEPSATFSSRMWPTIVCGTLEFAPFEVPLCGLHGVHGQGKVRAG